MKKRILSIITSASLIASALSFGTYAAPALVETADTALEYISMPEVEIEVQETVKEETVKEEAVLSSIGPSLVTVSDSATEQNTQFGTPDMPKGAYLMADLEGEGTEESPYLITSADDLLFMASNINKGVNISSHYKLTADIDLGGDEWTPIGYVTGSDASTNYKTVFSGVFDGAGYTVSNFKITKYNTAYFGLFGYVVNGTIKNLNIDNANINVDSSNNERVYVSPLAGRIVSLTESGYTSIINCNVTSSSVTFTSNGTIYAGGITGSAISDKYMGAEILLAFNTAECDFNIVTEASKFLNNVDYQVAYAGGIAGYLATESNSRITVLNNSANCNIYTEATEQVKSVSFTMSGGLFGDVRTVYESGIGGSISISGSHSDGVIRTVSGFRPYIVGGFAGQFYATKDLLINDCYSSADVYGLYHNAGYRIVNEITGEEIENLDPSAGGFVGQLFFDHYVTSYGKTIKNCYASGDVIDEGYTETTPKDYSFVGGFTAWTSSGVFENCYRFEAQTLAGSDLNYTDYGNIKVLSVEDSKYLDKYVGFDMVNTWQMDPEAEYFYPTLREKTGYVEFINDGNHFAYGVFGDDGRLKAPASTPTKAPSVSKVFKFNYWSLSEEGPLFNLGSDTVSENSTLYAVYTADPRPYTVSFMNDGKIFGSAQTLNYGSPVKAPEAIPEKGETERYYYEFSHWSAKDGGEAFDFTDYTVVGNVSFYAVFAEIDKTAWKGEIAERFTSGFGTEALPYIITSGEELALLAKVTNEQTPGYAGAYYELGANINLGGNNWVPIGNFAETPFSGHFNGNGYTVSNLKIANNEYAGLFGYVLNGTITKLGIKNLNINISASQSSSQSDVYVGALAGYVMGSKGTSSISEISVDDCVINIDTSAEYLYVGGIAGYGCAKSLGKTYMTDVYASLDIVADNSTGYNYIGSITGLLYLGSGSSASIDHSYSTGSISSKSYHSSRVGGLVGYLYSHGSGWSPEPNSLPDDSTEKKESASLAADDVDIMLSNSFAVTSIYSYSSAYNAYAGYIVAECNTHAGVENVLYPSNIYVDIKTEVKVTTKVSEINNIGNGAPDAAFKRLELLSDYLGFDIDETWTFIPSETYPVLICMYSDKPILRILESEKDGNSVTASLRVLFPEDNYTVVVGVYSERNQLIGVKRVHLQKTEVVNEFTVTIPNAAAGDYISVSAVEKNTLKPLHVAVTKDI